MYVMFQLRPFTVHNVFPCFYGPNKVIIINSNASADSLINAEIGKVIEWLKINKLSLNKNKSKYMTFHMPKKQIQHLTLKIDGINIEKVEEFNFLGLTMDTNLKWKKTHRQNLK